MCTPQPQPIMASTNFTMFWSPFCSPNWSADLTGHWQVLKKLDLSCNAIGHLTLNSWYGLNRLYWLGIVFFLCWSFIGCELFALLCFVFCLFDLVFVSFFLSFFLSFFVCLFVCLFVCVFVFDSRDRWCWCWPLVSPPLLTRADQRPKWTPKHLVYIIYMSLKAIWHDVIPWGLVFQMRQKVSSWYRDALRMSPASGSFHSFVDVVVHFFCKWKMEVCHPESKSPQILFFFWKTERWSPQVLNWGLATTWGDDSTGAIAEVSSGFQPLEKQWMFKWLFLVWC